jgi:hypothetical protein
MVDRPKDHIWLAVVDAYRAGGLVAFVLSGRREMQ